MIDIDGYRPNVGIILLDNNGKVFFAKRYQDNGWQFPQGGINTDETNEEAMYRELYEEIGLKPEHVELIGSTPGWLRYKLPKKYQRKHSKPLCIGQKQVWFLLKFIGDESVFSLSFSESHQLA
ncbi:Adenosine (5')-pentaphospho-(5'')-adenosine pyrophosphohydrolase [hydrothermal vent metagenome]|uniref:Adenosine (5')-pentaphospho-(5'')-adenosine pyrophosphohydrolase n=1 Tax=hydrothermal vent metagenome TaxID=652676 RepID=A0A3B0VS38_9ZZZZ